VTAGGDAGQRGPRFTVVRSWLKSGEWEEAPCRLPAEVCWLGGIDTGLGRQMGNCKSPHSILSACRAMLAGRRGLWPDGHNRLPCDS
jgi:hypothetical protein